MIELLFIAGYLDILCRIFFHEKHLFAISDTEFCFRYSLTILIGWKFMKNKQTIDKAFSIISVIKISLMNNIYNSIC